MNIFAKFYILNQILMTMLLAMLTMLPVIVPVVAWGEMRVVETQIDATTQPPLPKMVKVAGHSHTCRKAGESTEYSLARIKAWAARTQVDACGLGSPWTAENFAAARYNEGEFRDGYFAGRTDGRLKFDPAEAEKIVALANAQCGSKTLFYIDNETPKSRYGHLWHVGFTVKVPSWHDYSQDRPVWYSPLDDQTAEINPLTGKPHRRRTYREVVAEQRAAGALCVWAHPTSWWTTDGRPNGPFVTNIAAEMLPQLMEDGYLDGMTVQGYDAFHRDYQGLWFALLDRGYRVPGFSELDISFAHNIESADTEFFNCIPNPENEQVDLQWIIREFRRARHTMSNGITLTITVNGVPQGSDLKPSANETEYTVEVSVLPAPDENKIAAVELVGRGGQVLAVQRDFTGGTIRWKVRDPAREGGYLLARAFGATDGDYLYKAQQRVKFCAITNPVWLRTANFPAPQPITPSIDHLANRKVRELMDYLATGKFRDDFPGCVPGIVPVEAWRIDEMRTALTQGNAQ